MSLAASQFNFHDAQLADFSVGPRKEVTLHIALDPVWNGKEKKSVVVRFGAIENMPQVTTYFDQLERPSGSDGFVAGICSLTQSKKNSVVLALSDYGSLEIRAKKVSTS